MRTPLPLPSSKQPFQFTIPFPPSSPTYTYPSALAIATYAVRQLEDDPLFNAGHGAVFTRDGINELEASVMVSRPSNSSSSSSHRAPHGHHYNKRGVGVTGLRRVRNPILLARAILEHGDEDLAGVKAQGFDPGEKDGEKEDHLDVPSAQGHTLLHGPTAESLARQYGIALVDSPSYFYTQKRWDEHVRGLARARRQHDGGPATATASWSPDEYLPQGTTGAVALDSEGVLCVATSTGGMTNKLTGRIGDTPVVGAGFWAEEWEVTDEGKGERIEGWREYFTNGFSGPAVELSSSLRAFLGDCIPTPFLYTPLITPSAQQRQQKQHQQTKTRALAISGTGNGDSFMRVSAARSVGAMARWAGVSAAEALFRITGPGGELQRSAGDRWGRTGEGEGGMIGIGVEGGRAVVIHDHNSSGMFRAWIDDEGLARFKIWRDFDE